MEKRVYHSEYGIYYDRKIKSQFEVENFSPIYISIYDNLEDIVRKLAFGNPGAITVITRSMTLGLEGYDNIDRLARLGVKGKYIWKFFKDHCGEDFARFRSAIMEFSFGFDGNTRSKLVEILKSDRGNPVQLGFKNLK